MKTWLLCVLLLLSAAARPVYAVEQFEGVQYTLPAGWVTARQEGALIVRPGDATDDAALMLAADCTDVAQRKSFRAWFDDSLAASAGGSKAILTEGQVMAQRVGALERLSTARAVQYGGGRRSLSSTTPSPPTTEPSCSWAWSAARAHSTDMARALRSFFDSLSLPDARAAAGPQRPRRSWRPLAVSRSCVGVGRWQAARPVHTASASSAGTRLPAVPRARPIHDRLPPQGLNSIGLGCIGQGLPNSTGQCPLSTKRLTLHWPNGGVWEDAIVPTTTGMRFNGKGYIRAATVDLARTAGRFEGAQSTALAKPRWRVGRPLTRSTTITLDGKGGFTFDSATGGRCRHAVAFGSAAFSGTVSSMAYEAIFRLRNVAS